MHKKPVHTSSSNNKFKTIPSSVSFISHRHHFLKQADIIKNKVIGFSLIELMITITIAGIALAIALPSLGGFLAQMRVDNEVVSLQRLLLTARNTAINTGANVEVCPLKNDDTCNDVNDWTGRIGVVSSINGDDLIKEKEAIKTGDKLQFTSTSNSITYSPSGQLINTVIGTFNYCPKSYDDYSRGIDLSLAGRTYLSTDVNGDGKDQDRAGKNIVCN
ncbi:GspH/FimT family pseudopilin [Colwellia sp. E2M01]|uniref:GspH/FimT family pseudopilin n=1 Tax=Colwellia sp. E2M01 TaxID=2841561 RepID=UPI001C0802E7|nr:GspH/FimT family pseudopilin [Colwellia sp. E2M01]MBU2869398.1 GspH/FimT family pseudopilin [Colwellia sp. E2M01]